MKKKSLLIEKNEKNKFSLGDIAKVSVGYQDPPVKIMRFNGNPAIGIQVAGTEDSNIVEVGRQIDEKLLQLQKDLPIGIELHKISWQSTIVKESISGFVLSMSATIIAVMSFYPIYASEGSTGEYCRTLFVVVGISLMISWFIALLMTPQQCLWFLNSKKQETQTDEFNTPFFNRFRKLVRGVIRHCCEGD